MGLLEQLKANSSTFHIRKKEEIDMLFDELEESRRKMPRGQVSGICISSIFLIAEIPSRLMSFCGLFLAYSSTPPSLGVRNWNVVFPSALVMRKSPKTMTSMPMSTSMSWKSLSMTSTLVTKSPVGTSTWTR